MIKSKLPSGILGAFGCAFNPKRIKTKAPPRPKNIPRLFIQVIRSRKINADSTKSKTGESVIITELLMGVERLNPLKKASIFKTIPKKAQITKRNQSRRSIFSEGKKRLMPQNTNAAPETRNKINPKGWITSGINPLAMVWFIP